MNSYKQMSDILHRLADYHARLARYYEDLERQCGDRRVQMIAGYMAGQERRFRESLNRAGETMPGEANATWLQYVPDLTLPQLPGPEACDEPDAVDRILSTAQEHVDHIVAFLESLSTAAERTPAREVFVSLQKQQKNEWRQIRQSVEDIERL